MVGPAHPLWKGGRRVDSQGYVTLSVEGREIREHRLVMELHLGRPLRRDEHVHHRNHDKTDNRLENLELKSARAHVREHWQGGHYAARVQRQTKPDAACSDCGRFGRLRARGMCSRCYQRDYFRRNRAASRG